VRARVRHRRAWAAGLPSRVGGQGRRGRRGGRGLAGSRGAGGGLWRVGGVCWGTCGVMREGWGREAGVDLNVTLVIPGGGLSLARAATAGRGLSRPSIAVLRLLDLACHAIQVTCQAHRAGVSDLSSDLGWCE
jgi:hypothetical protein